MGFISRTLLPRIKATLPQYMGGANPTVYLGMPPLPIGGVKNATPTHIRGISDGSVSIVAEPVRTTDIKGRTKGRGGRFNIVGNKTKRGIRAGNNSKGVPKKKAKKAATTVRRMVKRKAQKRVNGRFVK